MPPCSQRMTPGLAGRRCAPKGTALSDDRITSSALVGKLIPVEQKPLRWRIHDSHVRQLAAECVLVSEAYGVRPSYGLLVLADGKQQHVPFTPELERRLRGTIERMDTLVESDEEPGPRWMGGRCRACGFFSTCWE